MSKVVGNGGAVLVSLMVLVQGCAVGASVPEPSIASGAGQPYASQQGGSATAESAKVAAGEAASPVGPKRVQSATDEAAPSVYHRPGLGTQWGEERESRIHETFFERKHESSPFAQVAIRYDDEDGVHALTGIDDRYAYPGVFALAGGALTVSLTESDGDPLPAVTAGSQYFVIGDEGDRYEIQITNHTPARFEVVTSVDGLDVLDGQDAAYAKRGYIVEPWGSLNIEGFRSSAEAVQAFRFGALEDSYAVARGRGADIGVVGVLVFDELGANLQQPGWNGDHNPNPFPGRFAPPPGY